MVGEERTLLRLYIGGYLNPRRRLSLFDSAFSGVVALDFPHYRFPALLGVLLLGLYRMHREGNAVPGLSLDGRSRAVLNFFNRV